MHPGEQAWLLGGPLGNHEFSRVFYQGTRDQPEPKYVVKEGSARLGKLELLHIAVDDAGAHLTWTEGYRTWIPKDSYQVTWAV